MEAIGDISATCDVSRLEVEGKLFDSRIQGGVLADGFNGLLAGLCTITPMSTFAQVLHMYLVRVAAEWLTCIRITV